jgi:hypothetical protein
MVDEEETGCRKYLMWFVRVIKVLTVISLLGTIAAYIIVIDYAVKTEKLNAVDKAFALLGNTGFIALCIVLIIAEFEPVWFIKHCVIMHFWAARGFWIVWMGIQTISTSKQLSATVKEDSAVDPSLLEVFGTIAGSVMIGCGLIFCGFTLMCIRSFADDPRELSEPLTGGSAGNADAVLAANLALALGMTPADAKKRFAKGGAKEAQKYAKERADEVAKLKGSLADAQKNFKAGASQATRQAAETYGSVQAGASTAAQQASSTYSAPPVPGGKQAADDDGPRRGGGDDEDELMRAYYGNAKYDH